MPVGSFIAILFVAPSKLLDAPSVDSKNTEKKRSRLSSSSLEKYLSYRKSAGDRCFDVVNEVYAYNASHQHCVDGRCFDVINEVYA